MAQTTSPPLEGVRSATIEIAGTVRLGGVPRDLSHDTLEFIIFQPLTKATVLHKETGNGITQDSLGNYRVTLEKDETGKSTFPDERYGYEVWWTEYPTGKRKRIELQEFFMDDSTK